MRSVIIGASAGLGRALAERLAEQGHKLFLVSSRQEDLEPIAKDLSLRFGASVAIYGADLVSARAEDIRTAALAALGGVDNLLLIAGTAAQEQDKGPISPDLLDRLVAVNFTAALQLGNAFLPDLAQSPQGNLVGAGSVAAVRGRRGNMVYGAAKRGLEAWFEAARHWLAATGGAKVQFYRLGYLQTRMTFGQKLAFPAMTPENAAARIAANLGCDLGTVYLPWWWLGIMTLIRWLPWTVFRRLDI